MSEKRKIQRFNLDEGRIWEAIEGLSPFKTTYTLEEVCEKLNEQQDTIRRLQDLCGESDGENAKLRIENKELQEEIKLLKPTNVEQYEQIVQLQEENEQLRKELSDCEKFRYTVFKRLNDEYIKECSIK